MDKDKPKSIVLTNDDVEPIITKMIEVLNRNGIGADFKHALAMVVMGAQHLASASVEEVHMKTADVMVIIETILAAERGEKTEFHVSGSN